MFTVCNECDSTLTNVNAFVGRCHWCQMFMRKTERERERGRKVKTNNLTKRGEKKMRYETDNLTQGYIISNLFED